MGNDFGVVSEIESSDSRLVASLYNFNIGSPILKPAHIQYLTARVLPRLSKGHTISVAGFASPTGQEYSNVSLSKARAASVVNYLQGLAPLNPLSAYTMADGEKAARFAGIRRGVEDGLYRAVLISVQTTQQPSTEKPPSRYFRRAWIYDASDGTLQDMAAYNSDPGTCIIPVRTPKQSTALVFLRDWLIGLVKTGTKFGAIVFATHGSGAEIKLGSNRIHSFDFSHYLASSGLENLFSTYGRVYFSGCNIGEGNEGWEFLEAAGKVFLRGFGGECFAWTSYGFGINESAPLIGPRFAPHQVHLWGELRKVIIAPGGLVANRVVASSEAEAQQIDDALKGKPSLSSQ